MENIWKLNGIYFIDLSSKVTDKEETIKYVKGLEKECKKHKKPDEDVKQLIKDENNRKRKKELLDVACKRAKLDDLQSVFETRKDLQDSMTLAIQDIQNGFIPYEEIAKKIDDFQIKPKNRRKLNPPNDNMRFNVRINNNRAHPSLIENLFIGEDETYGRKIQSNSNIRVGEIAIVTKPYASAIISEIPYCLTCHKTVAAFIPCTKCNAVLFCDWNCQVLNQTHSLECESIFHYITYENEDKIRIKCAIQMVFEQMVAFNKDVGELEAKIRQLMMNNPRGDSIPDESNTGDSKLSCIYNLCKREYERIWDHTYEAFCIMMKIKEIVKQFKTTKKKRFLQHLLAHNLAVLYKNAFLNEFKISQKLFYRMMIYEVTSYLNHSCVPNLINFMVGNTWIGIACRTIQANEQIFINYQFKEFIGKNKTERKDILERYYGFPCKCVKCEHHVDATKKKTAKAKMSLFDLEKELSVILEPTNYTVKLGVMIEQYFEQIVNKYSEYGRSIGYVYEN